jgi:hypothetical protein
VPPAVNAAATGAVKLAGAVGLIRGWPNSNDYVNNPNILTDEFPWARLIGGIVESICF